MRSVVKLGKLIETCLKINTKSQEIWRYIFLKKKESHRKFASRAGLRLLILTEFQLSVWNVYLLFLHARDWNRRYMPADKHDVHVSTGVVLFVRTEGPWHAQASSVSLNITLFNKHLVIIRHVRPAAKIVSLRNS